MKDPDFADPGFQAQMAALRRQFQAGLPARRTALVDAWAGCADGTDGPAWLQLRDVAHKLSGSAPSYGFEAIGIAARDLDGLLSGRPPCRQRALAEVAVMHLQALLDAAVAAP